MNLDDWVSRCKLGDLLVCLCAVRYYGMQEVGLRDTVHDAFAVGRVFRVVSEPCRPTGQHEMAIVQPIEGGATTNAALFYFLPLDELPSTNPPTDRLRLCKRDSLRIGGREYGLYLSDSDAARAIWAPKEELRRKGLIPGQAYKIVDWPVAGKVVRLDGVEGAYYVGIFEP